MRPLTLPTLGAATLALGLGAGALAHDDMAPPELGQPQLLRQHMMTNVGAAMKIAVPMMKGEAPFDAAAANAALRIINTAALGYGAQFPEGTDTGHETEAAPAIWSDRPGFDERVAEFIEVSHQAVESAPQELDAFKPVFQKVVENCKACHEDYRIKKEQ